MAKNRRCYQDRATVDNRLCQLVAFRFMIQQFINVHTFDQVLRIYRLSLQQNRNRTNYKFLVSIMTNTKRIAHPGTNENC